MALGKREQQEVGVATCDLPQSPGHPFYEKLNGLRAEAKFDDEVEALCRPYYADGVGRPGVPPSVSFRMLLVGPLKGWTLNGRLRGGAATVDPCSDF